MLREEKFQEKNIWDSKYSYKADTVFILKITKVWSYGYYSLNTIKCCFISVQSFMKISLTVVKF